MYVPKIFNPPSAEAVKNYIDDNGFATLISTHDHKIIATHTPLFIESRGDKEFLIGHIAAANNQRECIEHRQNMLAIFMEKHTYISSSWYDHINVPTWNYISVHIYGKARPLDGHQKKEAIHALVEKYESPNNPRFRISDMSERDLQNQLRGIVAFEIEIKHIEASWKLSQNRDSKNHQNIIKKLKSRGDEMSMLIAEEMETMGK